MRLLPAKIEIDAEIEENGIALTPYRIVTKRGRVLYLKRSTCVGNLLRVVTEAGNAADIKNVEWFYERFDEFQDGLLEPFTSKV